jgi:hypothetical protein
MWPLTEPRFSPNLQNYYSARDAMNTKKIRFQGLRRVYDVPSWSRFVPKGTAPKGAPTLILPTLTTNPDRVVVELFGHQGWTGSSNCWTGFSKSLVLLSWRWGLPITLYPSAPPQYRSRVSQLPTSQPLKQGYIVTPPSWFSSTV